jgi:uncharacterized spore protein YtfJ
MADRLTDMISSIMAELKQISKTETIIGEAVKLGDKMVVPVSKVSVGFGVGGGEGQADEKSGGFGGGGGGGARVEPVGFIVIQEDRVSFLATKPGRFEGLVEAIPGFLEKVKGITKGKGKDKAGNQTGDKGKED